MTKLGRNDLVRVVVEQLREEAEAELRAAEADVRERELALNEALLSATRDRNMHWLRQAAGQCGTTVDQLKVELLNTTEMQNCDTYPAGASIPIRLSDGPLYQARVSLSMRVPVVEVRSTFAAWIEACRRLRMAQAQDVRTKALDPKARAKFVDELLRAHPSGEAVLTALRKFSKEVADADVE